MFYIDLCRMMVSANIPLNKLNNKEFREFLEKYTQQHIPSESTLRQYYVPKLYDENMKQIRNSIIGNKIWISIDETTDVTGRHVANVIVGILRPNEAGKNFY